jgi:hypothetical protein
MLIQVNAKGDAFQPVAVKVPQQLLEDAMPARTSVVAPGTLGADAVKAVLGDVDDAKLIEIAELQPTLAELEQAAIWVAGNGDVLAKEGRPLTGTVAAIVEIFAAGEEEEPPPAR